MIGIVDYGVGNTRAFLNMYKRMNIACKLADSADELRDVEKVVLPGVGSFDFAMSRLQTSGLRETLDELVLEKKTPVLGVCVGMQMMAASSDEGELRGLNWVPGNVRHLSAVLSDSGIRLPHMGWNSVRVTSASSLFDGLTDSAWFYYLHSYYFDCASASDVLAECEYGTLFCCAVQKGNVFGVQFHPEKSHEFGAALLRNFAEL